jgi:hypothetical protein
MRLEGLGKLKKNPMTSSGIEPPTFWLVAQCLNQLRYRVLPLIIKVLSQFSFLVLESGKESEEVMMPFYLHRLKKKKLVSVSAGDD